MESLEFPAWIEIDTDAIRHNFRQMQQLVGSGVRVMAVVKADAYGCGAIEVARTVVEEGAAMLGVTHLQEAINLRQAGITAPILVFRPLLPWEVAPALAWGITASVTSLADLEVLAGHTRDLSGLTAHLKIETGLGRLGLKPGEELAEVARRLAGLPNLVMEGVYSHLATAAWGSRRFARLQFRRFLQAVEQLEQIGFTGLTRHLADSAAAVRLPEMRLDMVRIGSALYGQRPGGISGAGWPSLEPVWKVKCRIIAVRPAEPGTTVGYGRGYRVRRPTQLAVLPVGYADGLGVAPALRPRGWPDFFKLAIKLLLATLGHPAGGPRVCLVGCRVPVAGRIGMQFTVVDAGTGPEVREGNIAEVEMRHAIASPYLPRVYLRGGQPYQVRLQSRPQEQVTAKNN